MLRRNQNTHAFQMLETNKHRKALKSNGQEKGNIIDQLGSIIVMAFVFAMILAFAAYGKIVLMKLAVNNTAKEYLYKMEQNGYMSDDDQKEMTAKLEERGITVQEDGFTGTTSSQVPYGDQVVLMCKVEFTNPLYSVFKEGSYIVIPGFPDKLTYDVSLSATSKW